MWKCFVNYSAVLTRGGGLILREQENTVFRCALGKLRISLQTWQILQMPAWEKIRWLYVCKGHYSVTLGTSKAVSLLSLNRLRPVALQSEKRAFSLSAGKSLEPVRVVCAIFQVGWPCEIHCANFAVIMAPRTQWKRKEQ